MTNCKRHFDNKICLVTGGGSGIGKAVALMMAENGARVVVSGRNTDRIKEVAKLHVNISSHQLDVSEKSSWLKIYNHFQKTLSTPDFIVHNAGACKYIDLPDFPSEVFEEIMKVNFMGIINGISTFMPKMLEENKGHIIAVTSSVARLPLPRAEAYGASKAAATYMIDSLRIALSETNIKLTTVMPGFVETPMTDQNDFPMPFIIKPEVAADRIMKGIVKGKKDIFFPNRFTWPLRLIASLPTSLAYQFTKRLKR